MMKRIMLAGLAAAWATGACTMAAVAQTAPPDALVVLRAIDADNYDPVRSTARSAGEVVYMLADTLTSIDWDMKTVKPGLATSWTVSPDGRLYTFKLRDDVTFCDGRKMTADDVVYSITPPRRPATPNSPVRWRAGPVKESAPRTTTPSSTSSTSRSASCPTSLSLFFPSIVDQQLRREARGRISACRASTAPGRSAGSSWTPRAGNGAEAARGLQLGRRRSSRTRRRRSSG